MLKVVGASWLQTRISTYILVAVALLGIGAIILGEFGHVEKDGTYSATVSWNRKGGYRIDFWGQGNDLTSIPLNAARAYYKTGILENGWSIIEIETSVKYPDTVQAYAAGLLEGSLTWQLIHHHWHNTINVICDKNPVECRKLRRYLRENAAIIRERADLLESKDSFWHMVRLFYAQLDGLEDGWRFAVRRSRQSAELQSEDFLWLAMASDLSDIDSTIINNGSNISIGEKGMIFLKALNRENKEPLIAIGHNTAAPYAKMLRLLKRYKFNYHILPTSKNVARIPSRSIIMSSYPGALSSHDEFYLMTTENRELIIAGIPLSVSTRDPWNFVNLEDQVMSSIKIMTANRLATDSKSWSKILAFENGGNSMHQWITFEPRSKNVWFIEQLGSITHVADYSKDFTETGVLLSIGLPHFQDIKKAAGPINENDLIMRRHYLMRLQENITIMEHVREFMRGYNIGQEERSIVENSNESFHLNLSQIRTYRGDLEKPPLPFGVIDNKIIAADVNGLEIFEATSGPARFNELTSSAFQWSRSFPNISHVMGQPDIFDFDSVIPLWVWI
ncbi:putative phospholipase B-like lamina ancestor [Vespa crabro]|uniref:putative phospholipase B-like lamina ancestor n=1 Tax=Vespa crabro TaxID=7445 RepID=UPI001F015742|nr:putative phospholipase B-like lamina ancestor [Vespa crabro]